MEVEPKVTGKDNIQLVLMLGSLLGEFNINNQDIKIMQLVSAFRFDHRVVGFNVYILLDQSLNPVHRGYFKDTIRQGYQIFDKHGFTVKRSSSYRCQDALWELLSSRTSCLVDDEKIKKEYQL